MPEDILGRVVYSKSGRDKGRAFVVLGIDNNGYLLLADGELHKTEKPKKKNICHVQQTRLIFENLVQGQKLENHIVKKYLRQVLETEESAGKEV